MDIPLIVYKRSIKTEIHKRGSKEANRSSIAIEHRVKVIFCEIIHNDKLHLLISVYMEKDQCICLVGSEGLTKWGVDMIVI